MANEVGGAHAHPELETAIDGLQEAVANLQAVTAAIQQTVNDHEKRLTALEAKPPVVELPPGQPQYDAVVGSAAEMQAALDKIGAKVGASGAIMIAGIFPARSPIRWPQVAGRIEIYGDGDALISGTGGDYRILDGGDGTPGAERVFHGVHIDGGWLKNPGECPDDRAANFYFPGCDLLHIEDCWTGYSRRTGIYAARSNVLRVLRTYGWVMPRDFCWANDCMDVLYEDCVVERCGDDGIGCHVSPGKSDGDRVVIIRRNRLTDTFGIKVLGGGKQILIENNELILPVYYGIKLGIDATTGEGRGVQRNIAVTGNRITNLRHWARQDIQTGIYMDAPGQRCENVLITGNTIDRTIADGTLLSVAYPGMQVLAASKDKLLDDDVLTLGKRPIRVFCANPDGVSVDVNTITGAGWELPSIRQVL